jgi:hypothetical protein
VIRVSDKTPEALPDPIPNDHNFSPATHGTATCQACLLVVTYPSSPEMEAAVRRPCPKEVFV